MDISIAPSLTNKKLFVLYNTTYYCTAIKKFITNE